MQPETVTDWKTTRRKKKLATYFNHDTADGADVAVSGDMVTTLKFAALVLKVHN
jgi:hypothetical protein